MRIGTFIFNLKVSLAQREIGKTSERINFVFENKRLRGEVTSGQKKYGYDIINKHFIINDIEAENIINLFNYVVRVNGEMKKVYSYFTEHFPSKGYDALYGYLRDTSYIGKYKLYRKNKFLEDYIPRIMDDELFYQVQNLLTKHSRTINKPNAITSIFSGIIHCYECKIRMYKLQDYRIKKDVLRFKCDNASKYKIGSSEKKCSNNNSIREEYIEKYLLENITQLANNYISENTLISNNIKTNTTTNSNISQINKIEKKLSKLKELYLEDLIDKDTFKQDTQKLKLELSKLHNNTAPKVKKDFSNLSKIINRNFSDIYNNLSNEEKRTFWLNIIDKIYVYKGEIKEVIFL